MNTRRFTTYLAIATCALILVATQAGAGDYGSKDKSTGTDTKATHDKTETTKAKDQSHQIVEAANVVKKMETDAELSGVMRQARGILIIPNFAQAALGVGVSGGGGVLVVRQKDDWSAPAFYNIGGVSAGLAAGAEAGSIAMVLNTQKAVESLMKNDSFSLDAKVGLTVVNWSGKAETTIGKDVVLWSDTEGLFANAALEVKDVSFDETDNAKYYGKKVSLRDVIDGKVKNPQAAVLMSALPESAED